MTPGRLHAQDLLLGRVVGVDVAARGVAGDGHVEVAVAVEVGHRRGAVAVAAAGAEAVDVAAQRHVRLGHVDRPHLAGHHQLGAVALGVAAAVGGREHVGRHRHRALRSGPVGLRIHRHETAVHRGRRDVAVGVEHLGDAVAAALAEVVGVGPDLVADEDLRLAVAVEVRERQAEAGADVAGAVEGGLAHGRGVELPHAVDVVGDDEAVGERAADGRVDERGHLELRVAVEVGDGEDVAAVAVDGDRRLHGQRVAVEDVDRAGAAVGRDDVGLAVAVDVAGDGPEEVFVGGAGLVLLLDGEGAGRDRHVARRDRRLAGRVVDVDVAVEIVVDARAAELEADDVLRAGGQAADGAEGAVVLRRHALGRDDGLDGVGAGVDADAVGRAAPGRGRHRRGAGLARAVAAGDGDGDGGAVGRLRAAARGDGRGRDGADRAGDGHGQREVDLGQRRGRLRQAELDRAAGPGGVGLEDGVLRSRRRCRRCSGR
ncbi:MAG: hypothetical protein U1F43_19820 [Myxococcota bacterium]